MRTGSMIDTFGYSTGLMMVHFLFKDGLLITEQHVASEPVPAVVGLTISGNPGVVGRFTSSFCLSVYSQQLPP